MNYLWNKERGMVEEYDDNDVFIKDVPEARRGEMGQIIVPEYITPTTPAGAPDWSGFGEVELARNRFELESMS